MVEIKVQKYHVPDMNKAASNPPVIVTSSNIRTLGNGDSNRGRKVGVVRYTLGRRDSCQRC